MAYILARKYSRHYDIAVLENAASQESMINAGLTQNEINVAMMMLEGMTQRDITRKLNINADKFDLYEVAIRQKLGLTGSLDPLISGVAAEYGLTKRETEMLKYLRESATTEKIAADLFISEITVRSHISSLLTKLGIEKRQDVAAWLEKRE
jgi:Response regulator containing a CheY-like receiver domain and an HTH DNA-binding domain